MYRSLERLKFGLLVAHFRHEFVCAGDLLLVFAGASYF
jgi:hypothetical protein